MRHSNERPRILLTVRRPPPGAPPETVEKYNRSTGFYADAVRTAGGEPLVARAGDPIPDDYDAVLFSGGADVHPRYYRQPIDESVRETLTIDDARDTMEVTLARDALDADKPILCICRGIQLINVAAGGTLWQDLSLAGIDPADHWQEGRLETWEPGHLVVVEPNTRLAAMTGPGPVGVNTYHHQAVAGLAPGFRVVARAPDGTIEGIESAEHRFVVGVQWHPERMVSHDRVQRGLFARFVEAVRLEAVR